MSPRWPIACSHGRKQTADPARVGVFDTNGKLLLTLQHGIWDNTPWSIAMAPRDFGGGFIHAYNAVTGKHEGSMQDPNDRPLRIVGLWGLSSGNDSKAGPATTLCFAAGPNYQKYGLIGTIVPVASEQRSNNE